MGEVLREAEVNCQKNCGKNNEVGCQVQTQKGKEEIQQERVGSCYDHKESFKAEGNKEKARKRKHVCVCACTCVRAAWSQV